MTMLNLGSGPRSAVQKTEEFKAAGWVEVRVDIDPACKPDLVSSIIDLGAVPSGSIDLVFSSHAIEHLADHEVGPAFDEAFRVLRPNGIALITCPDIKLVAQAVIEHDLDVVIYDSPSGPITALDALYGHRPSIARGMDYMQHRTGFSAQSIGRRLLSHGFAEIRVVEGQFLDLWALAIKGETFESSVLRFISKAPSFI